MTEQHKAFPGALKHARAAAVAQKSCARMEGGCFQHGNALRRVSRKGSSSNNKWPEQQININGCRRETRRARPFAAAVEPRNSGMLQWPNGLLGTGTRCAAWPSPTVGEVMSKLNVWRRLCDDAGLKRPRIHGRGWVVRDPDVLEEDQ